MSHKKSGDLRVSKSEKVCSDCRRSADHQTIEQMNWFSAVNQCECGGRWIKKC